MGFMDFFYSKTNRFVRGELLSMFIRARAEEKTNGERARQRERERDFNMFELCIGQGL